MTQRVSDERASEWAQRVANDDPDVMPDNLVFAVPRLARDLLDARAEVRRLREELALARAEISDILPELDATQAQLTQACRELATVTGLRDALPTLDQVRSAMMAFSRISDGGSVNAVTRDRDVFDVRAVLLCLDAALGSL